MENIIELKGVSKIYKTGEKEYKALDNIQAIDMAGLIYRQQKLLV